MNFLEKYGFVKEDIDEFMNNTPKKMIDELEKHSQLVETNLQYLKKLGTEVYKEIFINYPDMFLLDASTFENRFSQYEADELLKSLNNNFKVVEYL